MNIVSNTTALLALTNMAAGDVIYLKEEGRAGHFEWHPEDLSAIAQYDQMGGVYVAAATVDPEDRGSTGAWVRIPEEPGVALFDWFGAHGDGVTNDYPVLQEANEFMRASPDYHELRFTRDKTYYLDGLKQFDDDAVWLDYDNILMNGNGCELKLKAHQPGKSVFPVGDRHWAVASNEPIAPRDFSETSEPELVALGNPQPFAARDITIRGFRVDFQENGAGQSFVAIRYPCQDVVIEDNEGYQSLYGDDTFFDGSDAWFVNQEVIHDGSAESDANPLARINNLTVRRNIVRNRMQLTAGGGRGINGWFVYENQVYNARANGITTGSVSDVCRMDNVEIHDNLFVGCVGRGILFGPDSLTPRESINPALSDMHHYARNVVIANNLFRDVPGIESSQAMYILPFAQGTHGITISGNVVQYRDSGAAIFVRTGAAYAWKVQKNLPRQRFDPGDNTITLDTTELADGYLASFSGPGTGVGIAQRTNYYMKIVTPGTSGKIRLFTNANFSTMVNITATGGTVSDTSDAEFTPLVSQAAFSATGNSITLDNHQLMHGTSLYVIPFNAATTMPDGLAAKVPYFVGIVDQNIIQLYETLDPATGVLSGLVDIGANASGTFMLVNTSVVTNLVIDDGNVFDSADISVISSIRGGSVGGRWSGNRVYIGGLADTHFTGQFTREQGSTIEVNQGGLQRCSFDGARFFTRGNSATDAGQHIVRAEFGDVSHYDLTLRNVDVEVDYLSTTSRAGPTFFYEETVATTPAQRKGPGLRVSGLTSRYLGTPANGFRNFGPAAAKNVVKFEEVENPNGPNLLAADYQLTINDVGRIQSNTGASNVTLNVPADSVVRFPANAEIPLHRGGTGTLTVAGLSGVTVLTAGGKPLTVQQNGRALLKKHPSLASTWTLSGDLG